MSKQKKSFIAVYLNQRNNVPIKIHNNKTYMNEIV